MSTTYNISSSTLRRSTYSVISVADGLGVFSTDPPGCPETPSSLACSGMTWPAWSTPGSGTGTGSSIRGSAMAGLGELRR